MAIYTREETMDKTVKEVMNLKETAEFLGITVPTLKTFMQSGTLPYNKVNRKIFFTRRSVLYWIENGKRYVPDKQ